MLTYYRSVPIASSSLTKYLRPSRMSVFQCEVWPMPNEQNINFSTEDVESVLNISHGSERMVDGASSVEGNSGNNAARGRAHAHPEPAG